MAAPQMADEGFNQKLNDGELSSEPRRGSTAQRITTGDRSSQIQKLNQTRNVRTSTMPGAPRNQKFDSSKPDIATEFNQSYAKQGLQPSSLEDTPTREPYQPARPVSRAQVEYSSQPAVALPQRKLRLKLKGGKLSTLKGGLARGRVTGLNTWIWSTGLFTWATFQLPFAILSLVFLGLAAAIEAFIATLDPTKEDGMIVTILKTGAKLLVDALEWVGGKVFEVFGINTALLDPMNFFLMAYLVVLAYGIFILFSIYLIYKISLLNPLSGKGAGMKKGAFLLALVGYAIPILNLFPWFIFWTMAVWRYPK